MKNRKKKFSQETRRLEEKLLTKQEQLPIVEVNADLPEKILQTKTYDVTSASLEVWLDEFIKHDPRARGEYSEGARALIRVSEQSNREGQWPKLAPRRNYAGTKYSNDLSVGRQRMTPRPVLPQKHFLTPKFAKKKDHHMFSKALPKLYDQNTGRRMPGIKWKPSTSGLKGILKKKKKQTEVKFRDSLTDMIEEIIMSPAKESRQLYPSTSAEESNPVHLNPPAIFPLPALLPPEQFLDPEIILQEPLIANTESLEVHEHASLTNRQKSSDFEEKNETIMEKKDFLRYTIREKDIFLLINLKRIPSNKNTILWVLNPSSGEIQKNTFPNTQGIFDALKEMTNKKSLAHLALNWALQELPKLMHDAAVFLAFYALIKGLQDVPLPIVVNRYESARKTLRSAPSGTAMIQGRPKSPLLDFLDALDPRNTDVAPITSLEKIRQFGGKVFRPKSSPGRIKFSKLRASTKNMEGDKRLDNTIAIANKYHPDISTTQLDSLSRKQHGCTGGTYSALSSIDSRSKIRHAVSHSRVPDENIHEIPGRQRTSLAVVAKRVRERIHTIGIFNHGFQKSINRGANSSHAQVWQTASNQHHGLHHDGLDVVTMHGQQFDTDSENDEMDSISSVDELAADNVTMKGQSGVHIVEQAVQHVVLQTSMKLPDFYDSRCKDFYEYGHYLVEIIDVENELHVIAIRANSGKVLRKVVSGEFLAETLAKHARRHGEILKLFDPNQKIPSICSIILKRLATVTGEILLLRDYSKR